MNDTFMHIEAFDCLPFENEKAITEVLQEFIKSQSESVFRLSNDYQLDDDSKLAEYDYKNYCWRAGRFVGEAIFNYNKIDYKITIKPRFGEKMLFRMLEEIFNIRITKSASEQSKSLDWQHYIKRIIGFIWLQKLANANLHGIPKTQIKKQCKGQTIRGTLDVRKSLKSLFQNDEIVSTFREKRIDKHIEQIVFQAYQILKTDFEIGKINIPDSAREAIYQINSIVQNKECIKESDYNNIRYKEIYMSWKPVVDLSWDIIKKKKLSLKQGKAKNGFGSFIDMAEVWEQYLRAILKKHLLRFGWKYKNEKQFAYKGFFFQRKLIPDIVFQKENDLVVWDAKYKRMLGRYDDVDRSDFFQIHTYIQNFLTHKSGKIVKTGGLLYPLSNKPNFEYYKSPYLIHEEGMKVNFVIDGIEMAERIEAENPVIQESEFLNRIIASINYA